MDIGINPQVQGSPAVLRDVEAQKVAGITCGLFCLYEYALMYHVYLLYSPSADKYYVGQTSDLELRLQYHNELNPDSYTSKHRPWELCRAIAVADQGHAIRMERSIKKRKSRQFIERLIEEDELVAWLVEDTHSVG